MLSLITDLFGPIFAKEMVEMARRWRYYQNRILFGGLVLVVLLIVYQETQYRYTMTGGFTVNALSKMAETFFLSYLWVQYIAVYLFVPFFLTGVISGEREQKTLDLLFTTQLTNGEIIFGKLGSRVVSMLMLIFSGVPIVAITMLFGGVNVQVFLYGMLATLLAVLYASAFAIYFSTTTKTTLGALVRTYWWMMCWLFIMPLVLSMGVELFLAYGTQSGMSMQTRLWWQQAWLLLISLVNPIAPFAVSVIDHLSGQLLIELGSWYFFYLLILPTLWSLLLIFLAVRHVRRDPGSHRFGIGVRNVIKFVVAILILKPITSRLLKYLPQGKADRVLWMPVHNPLWLRSRRAWVFDREQHLQRAQLGGWMLVIFALGVMFSLEPSFFKHREASLLFVVWIWFGLVIIASLVAGISIINDRRKGFFEFVLVTPLEPWEVIQGTSLACWRHIKKLYLLVVIMMVFFTAIGASSITGALISVVMGTLAIMLGILHGIACSLAARSVAGALIASFTFPLVILILSPLLSGMFRQAGPVIFWTVCAVLLPLSWLFFRWRKNAFTVTFFLSMFHLSLASLFTCWVAGVKNDHDLPLMSLHPGVHVMMPLTDDRYGPTIRYGVLWSSVQVLYATMLMLNMIWLFWWICRHYEVLSGRKEPRRRKKNSLAETSPSLPLAREESGGISLVNSH